MGGKLMVFRHGLHPHFHEEQGRNRIDQNHHEDRLNHTRGGVLANRLRTATDFKPLQAADNGNQKGKNRRLESPTR